MAEKIPPTFDWRVELLRMGIGQGPAFVVMVVMLWIMTTAIKDFVKVEIPKHIAAIKEGFQEVANKNNETDLAVATENAKMVKYLTDAFNYNMDRIEKRLQDHLKEEE